MNWRPERWYSMVESPYMHDGVKMAREDPSKALELEWKHQAFREGQEAGADAMFGALKEEIEKVENPYSKAKLASAEYYEGEGFHRACQAILKILEGDVKG